MTAIFLKKKKKFERLILKMSILTIYVILVTHLYHKKVMSLIPKDGSEKFVTTGCTVSPKMFIPYHQHAS